MNSPVKTDSLSAGPPAGAVTAADLPPRVGPIHPGAAPRGLLSHITPAIRAAHTRMWQSGRCTSTYGQK